MHFRVVLSLVEVIVTYLDKEMRAVSPHSVCDWLFAVLFAELSSIELVPESCCLRTNYDWDIIINRRICQTTQGGPPRTRVGSPNKFLNYQVNVIIVVCPWY